MSAGRTNKRIRLILALMLVLAGFMAAAFLVWTSAYYHAQDPADFRRQS